MARRSLLSIAVCLALVGCGSDSGTSGTVAQQPKACAQLRRQIEAKQGKGGDFECSVKGHKAEGTYSTGELTFPHRRGMNHQGTNEPMVVPARGDSPETEPRRLEFLGLEGKPLALADISWSSWGKVPAVGEAELQASGDCYPNCARIEYHDSAPVHVRLAQLDSKCGRRLYRRIIVIPENHEVGQYFPINCPE